MRGIDEGHPNHITEIMHRAPGLHGLKTFDFLPKQLVDDPNLLYESNEKSYDEFNPCYSHLPLCKVESSRGVPHGTARCRIVFTLSGLNFWLNNWLSHDVTTLVGNLGSRFSTK